MAVIKLVQLSSNVTLYSGSPQQVKYVSRDLSGAIYDFTGWNACTNDISCDNSGLSSGIAVNPTVAAADATGITLEYSTANIAAIQALLGNTRGWQHLSAGDGTDTAKLGYGTINVFNTGN